MLGIRPGNYPESAPPDFAKLGPGPGVKVQYFDSMDALGAFCRENGIDGHDSFNPQEFMGGYAPAKKIVALPRPGLLNDPGLDKALYQHEVGGHSNDLAHGPDGSGWGWNGPDGKFYPVDSMADLKAAQAKYVAPVAFDWSQAFATNAPNGAFRSSGSGSN